MLGSHWASSRCCLQIRTVPTKICRSSSCITQCSASLFPNNQQCGRFSRRFVSPSAQAARRSMAHFTYVSSLVPTVRPPDEVIIESTELSGRDVFEEVVDVGAILAMRDPLKTAPWI